MDFIVLGGGVSGLSCGIRLLEAGHAVQLWARELSPHTTSDVAAAMWYPYLASPKERVLGWGQRTYEVLRSLAGRPETGVQMVHGAELFTETVQDPWWASSVPGFRRAAPGELPPGYSEGYAFEVPVIEMPRYLPFLLERFHELGGRLRQREVHSLEEAWSEAPTVVNCTGLGARTLVGDEALFPIRGEVLRVSPSPTPRFLIDESEARGMTYLIPRATDCILGGTAEGGVDSLTPSATEAEGILSRCRRLLPEGTPLNVVEHRVGLRPGRPSVRLEAEHLGERRVIHNYGHGGAGVTLSWGCAEEVRALAEAAR
ncbi:FAD-dependent oxidoreductase [Stigmatella aurantiaca]|uniref:D-amino-acid oxidase n=1 Tax=Stigmatella aurantiaca (strain DW4/3-1) TaxID=378806 RepID=Q08XF1_STIAD|nr:FAD-dependent oxidoreductase [Stigmatella aurantiaca]ADO70684.1 D-amino acid oxidase [Stigmatella aurantiaca DW4/3-1]EAU65167.1 D-aspartate oxidase [Stigmatella aurantiaca DW4/3-1]